MAEFVRTRLALSKDPITVRPSPDQKPGMKPVGFWYSVDYDWERWCESEASGWLKDMHVHKVTLGAENILFVRTLGELDAFHHEFTRPLYRTSFHAIDWVKVVGRYDGIEIAPYQWDRRLYGDVSEWYYGWDCASGVIWRPKGITVEYVGEYKKKEEECDHQALPSP